MYFILSKDQNNMLAAIADEHGHRNAHEALDWALSKAAGPLMEKFKEQREAENEVRKAKFAARKKSVRTKNYRR